MSFLRLPKRRGISAVSQAAMVESLECRSLLSTVLPMTCLGTLVDSSSFTSDVQAYSQIGPDKPIATNLAAPVADSPGSATTPGPVLDTSTPTFTWESVTGASFYQVNLYDVSANKPFSFTTTSTSYALTDSLGSGHYYVWNVRAVNGPEGARVTSHPSAYLYFQAPGTLVTLTAPVADSPGSATAPGPVTDSTTPTFTWDPVSGAEQYLIYLYDKSAEKSFAFTVDGSATTFTPTEALRAGDQFIWNVRATAGGVNGPPSNYLFFQTPGQTVVLSAPVADSPGTTDSPGPVVDNPPTFQWEPVTGASSYVLTIYDISLGKPLTINTTSTSYTPGSNALAAGDKFIWNVRAKAGDTISSPSTYLYLQTAANIVTLGAPVAISPGDATSPGPVLTTLPPTFQWQSVDGATGYTLTIYDQTSGHTLTVPTTGTSYIPGSDALHAGDKFVWNVRATNGTGSGPPSNYLFFQTQGSTSVTLTAPIIDSPGSSTSPGPVLDTTTPTLSWEPVTGATGYTINLYDVTKAKGSTFTVTAPTTSYTVGDALTAEDTFVWNVRATAGTVIGPVSTYMYFQTPAATVTLTAPVIDSPPSPGSTTSPGPVLTTIAPTFKWEPVTGATSYLVTIYDQTSGKTLSISDTSTTYTPGGDALHAGDKFVWNVRAKNGDTSGPPSTYLYFQTYTPSITLTAPIIDYPGGTTSPGPVITTLTPTLKWEAVAGATGYRITLYDVAQSKAITYDVDGSTTSYMVAAGVLRANAAYVWNVRALIGTKTGPVSKYMYFQTPSAT
jgi:hypothetical protein